MPPVDVRLSWRHGPRFRGEERWGLTSGCVGQECEDLQAESRQFVSSVCWSRRSHTLLAANSQGTLKLLELE